MYSNANPHTAIGKFERYPRQGRAEIRRGRKGLWEDYLSCSFTLGRVSLPDSKDSYLIYSFLSVLQQDLQNFLHNNKPTNNTTITTRAICISPPFLFIIPLLLQNSKEFTTGNLEALPKPTREKDCMATA